MKKQRINGAIGALLDEYERSIDELTLVIKDINPKQLTTIVDHETKDKDCVSIQSILSHVIESGYAYVIEMRKWLGEEIRYRDKKYHTESLEYQSELKVMFEFNEELFTDYPKIQLCENNPDKKIRVRWGQLFDVEQLMEHAIVHILRHRRQIERFKESLSVTAL